jgi:hypothetical protein
MAESRALPGHGAKKNQVASLRVTQFRLLAKDAIKTLAHWRDDRTFIENLE